MPVRKGTENGRVYYQWGTAGTKYFGPRAQARAEAQGRAAHASGYRSQNNNQPRISKGRP